MINDLYGTDFVVRRFRRPRRDGNGTWDVTPFQSLTAVRDGERKRMREDGTAFDLFALRAQLLHGGFHPSMTLEAERLDPGDPTSPMLLDAVDAVCVLDRDDDGVAGLLLGEGVESPRMPWLYAAVERHTGLVLPMACHTMLAIRDETSETGKILHVSVKGMVPPDHHEDYVGPSEPVDAARVLRNLAQDSAKLRELTMMREGAWYRPVRQVVKRLMEERAHDGMELPLGDDVFPEDPWDYGHEDLACGQPIVEGLECDELPEYFLRVYCPDPACGRIHKRRLCMRHYADVIALLVHDVGLAAQRATQSTICAREESPCASSWSNEAASARRAQLPLPRA